MSKRKINYIDSKDEQKSVLSDDLDGELEVKPNMELVNTTSLDVKMVVSVEHLDES